MNCLENLEKCKASCCKVVGFNVPEGLSGNVIVIGAITQDKKYYYELHGFKVKMLPSRCWEVTIPAEVFDNVIVKNNLFRIFAKCKALTIDNKCSFHGTDKKPHICNALNEETAKLDKIIITEGCIYGNRRSI